MSLSLTGFPRLGWLSTALLFILLVVAAWVPPTLSAQEPTDREVAVWAAWLGQADLVAGIDHLKIRSEVDADGIARDEAEMRQRLEWASGALDGLEEETLEAFVAVNRRPVEIERWLNRRLVERVGKRPKLLLRETNRLQIGFSRVGFDDAGEQALLYVDSEREGTLFLLLWDGADWRIEGSWQLWMS